MASIIGKVVSGRSLLPLGDTVVTATGPEMEDEKTVVTESTGIFVLSGLLAGPYKLHLEKEGFHVLDEVATTGSAVHLPMMPVEG